MLPCNRCCVLACLVVATFGSAPLTAADEPVSFRNDVMAVLSRAGCNQGTCHGNLNGKAGFKLSLRGQDADFDFEVLTRGMLGRRLEVPAFTKEGAEFIAEMTMQPVTLEGEFVFTVFLRNVTERKRAEDKLKAVRETLRRERDLLKAVMDHLPDLVFAKDREIRRVHELIIQGYYDAGYRPTFVPADEPGRRVAFILAQLPVPAT